MKIPHIPERLIEKLDGHIGQAACLPSRQWQLVQRHLASIGAIEVTLKLMLEVTQPQLDAILHWHYWRSQGASRRMSIIASSPFWDNWMDDIWKPWPIETEETRKEELEQWLEK